MTDTYDETARNLHDWVDKLNEVQAMSHVVATLMQGGLASRARNGWVTLSEIEATAVYYATTNLCAAIRKTGVEFSHFVEAQQSEADQ